MTAIYFRHEPDVDTSASAAKPRYPVWSVYQWELEKLTAQLRVRLALAACVAAPFVFAVGLRLVDTVPADTLFGRWVRDCGLTVPLVELGFAGSWGIPLLSCLVAGDIFSAEDHYRTWSAILTRSVTRRAVFTGKVFATLTFVVTVLAVLAVSGVAAGVLLVGTQPLVGLSGTVIPAGHAALLVAASWASVVPAAIGFASLGILLSILSRNSLVGILGPTVIGLALQLALFVDGIGAARLLLLNWSFVAWHGLFTEPSHVGAIWGGIATSAVFTGVLLIAAWLVLRRRDVTGA